jgi:hypothetical protein
MTNVLAYVQTIIIHVRVIYKAAVLITAVKSFSVQTAGQLSFVPSHSNSIFNGEKKNVSKTEIIPWPRIWVTAIFVQSERFCS